MAHFIDATGSLSNARRTPQGGFVVDATLARTGILEYMGPGGSVFRRYNPPAVLQAAMDSLPMAPVTYKHPAKFVDVHNYQKLAAGHIIGAPEFDGVHLKATLAIQDAALIRAIELGEAREVSMGYTAEHSDEAGVTPEGETYDQARTSITWNHLAIVPAGRAGRSVRLMLDGEDIPELETRMLKINGQEIEFEGAQAAFDSYDASLQASAATLQAQLDEATNELNKLRAELVEKTSESALDALFAAREARREAERLELVKRERIAKHFPGIQLDGRSQDFVDGLAAALPVETATVVDAADDLHKVTAPVIVPAKPKRQVVDAYEKMRAEMRAESLQPLKADPSV